MFKREHHLRIATILQSLDADLLAKHECLFGGGTAIVLARNEYRESIDIDFVISNREGFRFLRQKLTGEKGLSAILRPKAKVKLAREIRADQYGIRTMVEVGGVEIKLEIILEGRIDLEPPASSDQICGVKTLSTLDMGTTKILANSVRWSDDSVHSRDLIDLAQLELKPVQLGKAMAKAQAAYGDSASRDLKKAIEKMKERTGRLSECMHALKMDAIPEALLWSRIRSLKF